MNYTKLGKTISYILRHHPEEYHLELDEDGWICIEDLFEALKEQFQELDIHDIYNIMNHSDKKRYEIKNGKIRAIYGHSLSQKIEYQSSIPPDYLFHGTAHRFLPSIIQKGLLSMDRQYVHLSQDIDTAIKVGKRHDKQPVILKIHAKKAYNDHILFYKTQDQVWLSESIPSKYLDIIKE